MVDVTLNTGTTIGLSASLPATYDSAGYAALSFTDIGEVVNIGEISKAFAIVAHQSIGRAYPQKLKDTYDVANVSLTLGRVTANTGQVAIAAALASAASVAFKVLLPSGDIGYLSGKVVKAGIGAVAPGGVSTTVVEIAVDPETLVEVV